MDFNNPPENKVVIVGGGVIGNYNTVALLNRGYQVKIYDIQDKVCNNLNKKYKNNGNFFASNDPSTIFTDFNIVLICVPTPIYNDGTPNAGPLNSAAKTIAKYLKKDVVISIESTIWPGFIENEFIDIIHSNTNLRVGRDFYVIHCSERVSPGDDYEFTSISRIVGGYDKKSLEVGISFYKTFIEHVEPVSSLITAELTKLLENSFRDLNIAFVNEFAELCDKLGVPTKEIIDAAATKPFGFYPHYPGSGVGGECIPVDPYFLIWTADKINSSSKSLLTEARKINNERPLKILNKVENLLKKIKFDKDKHIKYYLFGISYKPGISDLRNAPSLQMIKYLNQKGILPHIIDPDNNKTEEIENIYSFYKLKELEYSENEFLVIINVNGDNRLSELLNKIPDNDQRNFLIIDPHNSLDLKGTQMNYWTYGITTLT